MDSNDPISRPFLMKNTIQTYAWGSHTAISALLGEPSPSAKPQAELWMGAHAKAPSLIRYHGRWQALDQLIMQYPEAFLGKAVSRRFGSRLPFLLKVLAAEQPLSIQAHPDKKQAKTGFLRENDAKIDLDAAHRNYKDPQHKPECICALTPFVGMCGFRSLTDMMSLMGSIWPTPYNELMTVLTQNGVKPFFRRIMTLPPKKRLDLVARSVENAQSTARQNSAPFWIVRLNEQFPGDIGVLAPLFLNIVTLQPGEAVFLPARQLHAYLNGVGIEIMANSDNVLRGGLTPKHVDVPELLQIVDFGPYTPKIFKAEALDDIESVFHCKADEFELSILRMIAGREHQINWGAEAVCILFCTRGEAKLNWNRNETTTIQMGESVLIPGMLTDCRISGEAKLFKATIDTSSFK
jgi:mannose-6-phosphate isomerase